MAITYDDLLKCLALRRESANLADTVSSLRSMIEKSTSMPQSSGKVRSSGRTDSLEIGVIRLVELESVYKNKIDKYLSHVAMVENEIDMLLNPSHRTVLRLRFIEGHTWDKIAIKMSYSERWCRKLLTQGLLCLGVQPIAVN